MRHHHKKANALLVDTSGGKMSPLTLLRKGEAKPSFSIAPLEDLNQDGLLGEIISSNVSLVYFIEKATGLLCLVWDIIFAWISNDYSLFNKPQLNQPQFSGRYEFSLLVPTHLKEI